MTKVFIFHGTGGGPEGNWFPWLADELRKLGHEAYVPRFPTPENQSLASWNEVFKKYEDLVDEDTIFVGHSLAPAFILTLLERFSVKASFMVSGFLALLGDDFFDSRNRSFVTYDFDWAKIKENCKQFFCYGGDDDPYVPLNVQKEFANKLSSKLKIVIRGGHLNEEFGYTKFPRLLEDIKKVL